MILINPFFFNQADPNVVFLAFFYGANGATSFPTTIGNAMTAVGGAALTTAKTLYGSTSLYLDGSGDYVSIAQGADFSFGGTTDFCVEMWVWLDSSDVSGGFYCITNRSHYISPGGIVRCGNAVVNSVSSNFAAYDDKWTHIAHTRSSGVHRLFFDGTLVATSAATTQVFGSAVSDPLIGRDPFWGEMKMWVDSIRIYKGVPKYTSAFTPGPF